MRRQKRKEINYKKIAFIFIIILIIFFGMKSVVSKSEKDEILGEGKINTDAVQVGSDKVVGNEEVKLKNDIDNTKNSVNDINDWRLVLVNKDNKLPEDFSINLIAIDEHREFDSRAINQLKDTIENMRKSGASNVWVQSAYRSIETQTSLFNNKVNEYIRQGKTKKEAEALTENTINRPGTSEHNLGLAVDFNYVDYNFDTTKAFKWLKENAEKYGFILRYPKEKESITKVNYEPWHWRYVGVEHAKEINELGYCLEEYIEYLKNK